MSIPAVLPPRGLGQDKDLEEARQSETLAAVVPMKRILLTPLLLLAVLAADRFPPTRLPPEPTAFDPVAIDAYAAAQVKDKGIVGLSLAVVRDGTIALAKGYGRTASVNGEPVTTNTLFAIGSVTKQFTCACILRLAEAGKLSVRDKVSRWFPELTRAQDISLLDLMHHVSGYPDYYPLDFVDRRMSRPIAADELLRQYATGKLDFDPGARWSYSNTG